MALFKFTDAIFKGQAIDIYGEGRMSRDFTYVDDLVEAIVRLVPCVPARSALGESIAGDSLSPAAPFRIVNIGRGAPVGLLEFVEAVEAATGKAAKRNLLPMQPGDVPNTYASADLLEQLTGYRPATSVGEGVAKFAAWFRGYCGS
jgi:UDP-glucuronate 4-epimerase